MRQPFTIPLLSLAGLLLVYSSVVAAEAISTTGMAVFLRSDVDIPVTVFRIAMLSVTAFPTAYLTRYALMRWVPALGLRVIPAVALRIYASLAGFDTPLRWRMSWGL